MKWALAALNLLTAAWNIERTVNGTLPWLNGPVAIFAVGVAVWVVVKWPKPYRGEW